MKKKRITDRQAKLATLVAAVGIWYLIKYILENENQNWGKIRPFEQRDSNETEH